MERSFLNLEEFVITQITSLDHLHALLLCQADPQTEWDAAAAGCKLRLLPTTAAAVLAELEARRLLVSAGDPRRYRYEPQTRELARLTEELAELDHSRPVTLVTMVYDRAGTSRHLSLVSCAK